jgi:hypothetical protein
MARTEVRSARPEPSEKSRPEPSAKPRTVDSWMGEDIIFSALVIKKQSLILFLLRLPAFIPWIFVARGWLSLNEKESLTNTEADILGTGGGRPGPGYGQHPGAAEARKTLENCPESDIRTLGADRYSLAAARRIQALRRIAGRWRPRLPPALLPVRRDKPPADHPEATPGTTLGYQ